MNEDIKHQKIEEIRLYKNDKEKLNQIIQEKKKDFQKMINYVLSERDI